MPPHPENMQVLFHASDDREWGSSRIWVHDLRWYWQQLGYKSDLNQGQEHDVVIFAKGTPLEVIQDIKSQQPGAIYGLINPAMGLDDPPLFSELDFCIVGSIEEQDFYRGSLANVLMFPLVERIYTRRKLHDDHAPIVLGYHGNLMHLEEFFPRLTRAIERLAETVPTQLIAIYNEEALGPWTRGRPRIDVEIVQWRRETIEDSLLRCDIGLVPGVMGTPAPRHFDLRFKLCANAGRAFVFHQLGIPVVADFIPSCFHILADPRCGFLAHHEAGWLHALRELSASAELRASMATHAHEAFTRLYDPSEWSARLWRQIAQLTRTPYRSGTLTESWIKPSEIPR